MYGTTNIKYKQCYSDFTVGILKVLLTTTTGCLDSLTYIIQPHTRLFQVQLDVPCILIKNTVFFIRIQCISSWT
jgi:hypothetical protein